MYTMNHSLMQTSAEYWGAMWGNRPDEWAVSEEQQTPVYEAALARVSGEDVLDVGCGTGVFLRLCADRGSRVTGIDAAAGLLELAKARVPEANLTLGDLQRLPYADDSFDLVTGFTSFFFADDLVEALREAGRVAKPNAPVVIQVFGDPARCDLEAVKGAISRFRGEEIGQYWRPGAIEALLPAAGLTLDTAFDVTWSYEYADDASLTEAMLAAGGAALIAGPEHEAELGLDILRAVSHCRRPDGSYRLSNEWHVVVAVA